MELAQFERKCEEKDLIRSLRSDIINFAGNGAKKVYSPQEIQPIPLIDNEHIILPIRNMEEALKLFKMFEAQSG